MPSLSWLHKQNAEQAATKVPHHLLTVQSVHGDTTAGNLLIQGDNLLAVKALLPAYRGRVKCIFIDPPYNTQSAFEHYNDKLEHSLWLTFMNLSDAPDDERNSGVEVPRSMPRKFFGSLHPDS